MRHETSGASVLGRPDVVAAAPTLPGVPRLRLPPISPHRFDGKETKVFHLHSNNQRLVAHHRKSETRLQLDAGIMRPATAAALVGAGVVTVVVLPLLASRFARTALPRVPGASISGRDSI